MSEYGIVQYYVKAMRECEIDSGERNLEEFTEKTTICGAKPTPPYLGLTDK